MTLLGSQQTGLGSVRTASEPTDDDAGPATGDPLVVGKFSGTLVQQPTGTSETFLSDTGELAPVPFINDGPQLYPTSARTIKGVRVTSKSGTGGKALVVTLYKNGAATAMTVTIAASAAPGTEGSDFAHAVAFADGDTYDLHASMTSGTGDGPYFLSATLEGGAGGGGGGGTNPTSAVPGLTFPVVAGAPRLTAAGTVVLPGLEIDSGTLVADAGVPVTLHDTLEVDGTATLNGPLDANNGLAVQGGATVQGGIEVITGPAVFDAGVPVTVHDALEVDGAATLNSASTYLGNPLIAATASADVSVLVSEPTPGDINFKWNGVRQYTDSYGSVDDAPALNAALAALAARSPNSGGVVPVDGGTHDIRSQVTVPPGCSIDGAGKDATIFRVVGNGFDAFNLTNPYGCAIRKCSIVSPTPRTSGIAIHIVGGNPGIQPFFSGGGYTLSANETEVDQVNLDGQFDGIVIENNGAVAAWLAYIRNGLYSTANGGDQIRIDCPGTTPVTYGASFFVQRVFVVGQSAAPALSGNALRIRGAGDFTIEKFQSAIVNNGLVIDPVGTGRLSTGRFSLCQFDTAASLCASILPATTAIFGDIAFDTCWFAGGGTHNVLVNSNAAQSIRFMNSFFFDAAQYGLVLTGTTTGAAKIQVIGNQFSGGGSGGLRAVNARNFDVSHNQFYPTQFPPNIGMPQAVTVDLGCQDFMVTYNDWHLAAAGLLDNSGAVNKIVTPNLA